MSRKIFEIRQINGGDSKQGNRGQGRELGIGNREQAATEEDFNTELTEGSRRSQRRRRNRNLMPGFFSVGAVKPQ